MRKFLPIFFVTLLLCYFVTWQSVLAHMCGQDCDAFSNETDFLGRPACSHGCQGDMNTSNQNELNAGGAEQYWQQQQDQAAANAAADAAAREAAEANTAATIQAAADAKAAADALAAANAAAAQAVAARRAAEEKAAADAAPPAGGERCDGWAEPGSEHRNSGNGCFYTCTGGSWTGPNRCDNQGNGLFQGDASNLSPEEIAKAVSQRQSEAYLTVLKQDGKMLVKDENGEDKIVADPNADPNRKTTAQIAAETASQRTAEQGVQAQIAIKEYETKVAAANRETNPEIRNQMLAEFALLYQNSVDTAATDLSHLDATAVSTAKAKLESEGGGSIGVSSGSGATAICQMLDKPGGTVLGWVPCDDTKLMSDKKLYGTKYQFDALRYGLELIADDLGKDPAALKAKLAKTSAARIDATGKVLNSAVLNLEDKDGKAVTLDFEAEAKKNSGYLAIYCGGCGGFAADPKGPGCNAEIEAKKAAGTCSSDPPICKNPDGSLCAVNKDNKAQYGTKSEEGVVYSYVPSIGWQTATQIATSELADPKKCVEKLGQYACDQISGIQDTNIQAVTRVLEGLSSSQTIAMGPNNFTVDGVALNDWIRQNAHLPLTNNDISILNNQANGIATQVYSFQEVSKGSKFKEYVNCVKNGDESKRCREIGNDFFKDTNYAKLTPENQGLILINLAVNAGSQNPDRRADVFSFLGLSNTEISSANNQINQNVHISDLANKYQSGGILTPDQISQISKYYDINRLNENRNQNMEIARQNQINSATLNLYNAGNLRNVPIEQTLAGLDATSRTTAQNNATLLQQFIDCRPPKNCTNLFSQLQNTNLPKDVITEINKIRVDQITRENNLIKDQIAYQAASILPKDVQSAIDTKYTQLENNLIMTRLAASIDPANTTVKLSDSEKEYLRQQAFVDVLSQHPESVTLNPSTDQTEFQNYINNWKAPAVYVRAPTIDQLKQDAVKFAVQTCATSNNLSTCTQSRTLDTWGAAQRVFEGDPTLTNLPTGNQLYQDFLAQKVNPIELEQNLINIRSDWKNVVALKVNNIFNGTTATGTLLQKEAKESGLDSYENIYKYMRGTWIAGAPIAAAGVAIAGIGLLPIVAPTVAAVTGTGLLGGVLTTVGTGFGIYGTTQGIGSTYQACPDGAFAGTSEQKYACTTTGLNTIYMALSTGMGVATGAYASASKAATTLNLSKIGNSGSTLVADVNLALKSGTIAVNIPAWVERVGFVNSIIGMGVFGSQAVVECGKGLSVSCVINFGMAIGSAGHFSTSIASRVIPTSNIDAAIALGRTNRVSGEISELADKLDGLNSCKPTNFNIGDCISGLIDGFADGNSVSVKNNMLQAPTGLVSAQQRMNELATNLQTSSTDALDDSKRITMTKAVMDAIDENRYIRTALETKIPDNPTAMQWFLSAYQTAYDVDSTNPANTYNLLHALYLVQQERVLLTPVRTLFPSQDLKSLQQAQQKLDQIAHNLNSDITTEYLPQANKVLGLLIAAQKEKFTPEQAQQVETALTKLTENLQQQATANAEAARQTGDSSFTEAAQEAEQTVSALEQSQSPTPPNFFARLRGAGLPSSKLNVGNGTLGAVVDAVRTEGREITRIRILDNKGAEPVPSDQLDINNLFFKFNEVGGTRVEFRYADGTSRTFVSPNPGQAYGLSEVAPRVNLLQATDNYFQNLFLQGQTGRTIENLDIRRVRNPGIAQQLASRDDLSLSITTRQNRIPEINSQIANIYAQADANGLLDEHSKIVSIKGPKENGVTLGRRLINQVDDLVLERTNLENELVGLRQQLQDNLNEPLIPSVPEPVAKPDTPPNFFARLRGAGLPSSKLDVGDGSLGPIVDAVKAEGKEITGVRILDNKGVEIWSDTKLTNNDIFLKFNAGGTRVEFSYVDGTSRTFVSPNPGQAYGLTEQKPGFIASTQAYLTNLIPTLSTVRVVYDKQTQIININKQIDEIYADARANNLLNDNGDIVYQRGTKNREGVTYGTFLYNQVKGLTTERTKLENEIVELKKPKRIPNLQSSLPIGIADIGGAISPLFPPLAHLLATNPPFISQVNWYWNNLGLVAPRVYDAVVRQPINRVVNLFTERSSLTSPSSLERLDKLLASLKPPSKISQTFSIFMNKLGITKLPPTSSQIVQIDGTTIEESDISWSGSDNVDDRTRAELKEIERRRLEYLTLHKWPIPVFIGMDNPDDFRSIVNSKKFFVPDPNYLTSTESLALGYTNPDKISPILILFVPYTDLYLTPGITGAKGGIKDSSYTTNSEEFQGENRLFVNLSHSFTYPDSQELRQYLQYIGADITLNQNGEIELPMFQKFRFLNTNQGTQTFDLSSLSSLPNTNIREWNSDLITWHDILILKDGTERIIGRKPVFIVDKNNNWVKLDTSTSSLSLSPTTFLQSLHDGDTVRIESIDYKYSTNNPDLLKALIGLPNGVIIAVTSTQGKITSFSVDDGNIIPSGSIPAESGGGGDGTTFDEVARQELIDIANKIRDSLNRLGENGDEEIVPFLTRLKNPESNPLKTGEELAEHIKKYLPKKSQQILDLIAQRKGSIQEPVTPIKEVLPWQKPNSGDITDIEPIIEYLKTKPHVDLEIFSGIPHAQQVSTKNVPLINILDAPSITNWSRADRGGTGTKGFSITGRITDETFLKMVKDIRDGEFDLNSPRGDNPINLIHLGNNIYVATEGTTRIMAAWAAGKTDVPAQVSEAVKNPWKSTPQPKEAKLQYDQAQATLDLLSQPPSPSLPILLANFAGAINPAIIPFVQSLSENWPAITTQFDILRGFTPRNFLNLVTQPLQNWQWPGQKTNQTQPTALSLEETIFPQNIEIINPDNTKTNISIDKKQLLGTIMSMGSALPLENSKLHLITDNRTFIFRNGAWHEMTLYYHYTSDTGVIGIATDQMIKRGERKALTLNQPGDVYLTTIKPENMKVFADNPFLFFFGHILMYFNQETVGLPASRATNYFEVFALPDDLKQTLLSKIGPINEAVLSENLDFKDSRFYVNPVAKPRINTSIPTSHPPSPAFQAFANRLAAAADNIYNPRNWPLAWEDINKTVDNVPCALGYDQSQQKTALADGSLYWVKEIKSPPPDKYLNAITKDDILSSKIMRRAGDSHSNPPFGGSIYLSGSAPSSGVYPPHILSISNIFDWFVPSVSAAGPKAPCGTFNISDPKLSDVGTFEKRNDGLYFENTKITKEGILVTAASGDSVKLYQSSPDKIKVDNQPDRHWLKFNWKWPGIRANINSSDLMSNIKKNNIPVPSQNYYINEEKANNWINSFSGQDKEIAKLIIQNISHITFTQFLESLAQTVSSLNNSLVNKRYVILVNNLDLNENKSTSWIYDIVKPFLPPGGEIVKTTDIHNWIRKNPNVKDFVVLDDASYSATQLKQKIGFVNQLNLTSPTVHISIPFMTNYSISQVMNDYKFPIVFHGNQKIESFQEIIDRSNISSEVKRRIYELYSETQRNVRSFFYFDHKIPDQSSTALPFEGELGRMTPDGIPINKLILVPNIPFIQNITPPYKEPVPYTDPTIGVTHWKWPGKLEDWGIYDSDTKRFNWPPRLSATRLAIAQQQLTQELNKWEPTAGTSLRMPIDTVALEGEVRLLTPQDFNYAYQWQIAEGVIANLHLPIWLEDVARKELRTINEIEYPIYIPKANGIVRSSAELASQSNNQIVGFVASDFGRNYAPNGELNSVANSIMENRTFIPYFESRAKMHYNKALSDLTKGEKYYLAVRYAAIQIHQAEIITNSLFDDSGTDPVRGNYYAFVASSNAAIDQEMSRSYKKTQSIFRVLGLEYEPFIPHKSNTVGSATMQLRVGPAQGTTIPGHPDIWQNNTSGSISKSQFFQTRWHEATHIDQFRTYPLAYTRYNSTTNGNDYTVVEAMTEWYSWLVPELLKPQANFVEFSISRGYGLGALEFHNLVMDLYQKIGVEALRSAFKSAQTANIDNVGGIRELYDNTFGPGQFDTRMHKYSDYNVTQPMATEELPKTIRRLPTELEIFSQPANYSYQITTTDNPIPTTHIGMINQDIVDQTLGLPVGSEIVVLDANKNVVGKYQKVGNDSWTKIDHSAETGGGFVDNIRKSLSPATKLEVPYDRATTVVAQALENGAEFKKDIHGWEITRIEFDGKNYQIRRSKGANIQSQVLGQRQLDDLGIYNYAPITTVGVQNNTYLVQLIPEGQPLSRKNINILADLETKGVYFGDFRNAIIVDGKNWMIVDFDSIYQTPKPGFFEKLLFGLPSQNTIKRLVANQLLQQIGVNDIDVDLPLGAFADPGKLTLNQEITAFTNAFLLDIGKNTSLSKLAWSVMGTGFKASAQVFRKIFLVREIPGLVRGISEVSRNPLLGTAYIFAALSPLPTDITQEFLLTWNLSRQVTKLYLTNLSTKDSVTRAIKTALNLALPNLDPQATLAINKAIDNLDPNSLRDPAVIKTALKMALPQMDPKTRFVFQKLLDNGVIDRAISTMFPTLSPESRSYLTNPQNTAYLLGQYQAYLKAQGQENIDQAVQALRQDLKTQGNTMETWQKHIPNLDSFIANAQSGVPISNNFRNWGKAWEGIFSRNIPIPEQQSQVSPEISAFVSEPGYFSFHTEDDSIGRFGLFPEYLVGFRPGAIIMNPQGMAIEKLENGIWIEISDQKRLNDIKIDRLYSLAFSREPNRDLFTTEAYRDINIILRKLDDNKEVRTAIDLLEELRDRDIPILASQAKDKLREYATNRLSILPRNPTDDQFDTLLWALNNNDQDIYQLAQLRLSSILTNWGLDPVDATNAWKHSLPLQVLGNLHIAFNLVIATELERERPGILSVLWNDFGIKSFSRYPEEFLISQYDQRNSVVPYGIVITAISDPVEAFTHNGEVFGDFIEDLQGKYLLRFTEAGSKIDLARILIGMRNKYGKLSFAIIQGHGTENSIRLSATEKLTTDDLVKSGALDLDQFFEPDPTIVLASCSTGVECGIGQQMSQLLKATIIAPPIDTGVPSISVKFAENDKPIFDVKYTESSTNTFSAGEKGN